MLGIGKRLTDGLRTAANEAGVAAHFTVAGYPCRPELVCRDASDEVSLPFRTLVMQEMIRNGILMSYIVPSFAHDYAQIDATIDAAHHALAVYARALNDGWERHLQGSPVKPVFRTYN